ncbi:hypothetical protein P168DRAFT_324260 [Aspergillus campestris IBT 28561]|uniref:DUF676 domain-containing protein n=1 Tax=Aspergillus campestris (strain IBT 28561) TaxID=1392248 RepID=A0A2I1DHC2_ASPC2|nr:uncharacterized protein P168DRAFT_324260 [Aspergillus campestris IBT 28561]PKY09268.1 hypothetical protein P168DRAFT_324260 [Aspergillus campestris IBT 28561]
MPSVSFLPSQVGSPDETPLPYTSSPLRLLASDIVLVIHHLGSVQWLFSPLWPCKSGALDETYPSRQNIWCGVVHVVLVIAQLLFLVSLVVCVICLVPALWVLVYVVAVVGVNYWVCGRVLNGEGRVLRSGVDVDREEVHGRECWVYVNGVAAGQHWMQQHLDRLAYTFGRKITGVHNRTFGIVFDIIECLIQRCFSYATQDVREAYAIIKEALLNPEIDKVILLLHSQGGIEGGLIIDWLLDEMPQDLLCHLEVYTFGNAANHFNNPFRRVQDFRSTKSKRADLIHSQRTAEQDGKSICHIEHYVNSKDFVGLWGVVNFINVPNRYMGRLFVRSGPGHLLNQHYMDSMFPLGPDMRTLETNEFMETEVDMAVPESARGVNGNHKEDDNGEGSSVQVTSNASGPLRSDNHGNPVGGRPLKVKDLSRLWLYRNGSIPPCQEEYKQT